MSATAKAARIDRASTCCSGFVGFFGVVFAVNAVMVKAATSTFGGVETSSSYKAGLMFEQDVARAEQQDALHWQVGGKLARDVPARPFSIFQCARRARRCRLAASPRRRGLRIRPTSGATT